VSAVARRLHRAHGDQLERAPLGAQTHRPGLDARIVAAQVVSPYRRQGAGGKNSLGGITKRGDNYLRSLLIQGAKSAVMTAHKRSDPISVWAAALRERVRWQKAVVALANKNARILWAVMTRGGAFNPRHVSVKPGASAPTPVTAWRTTHNQSILQQASSQKMRRKVTAAAAKLD
jgi:hypothetical protein